MDCRQTLTYKIREELPVILEQSRFPRVGGLHNYGPTGLSRTDPGVGGPVLGIARVNSFEGDL
jgi:hypothetical protein